MKNDAFTLLEKIVLNTPIPFLTVYNCIKSNILKDEYFSQNIFERNLEIKKNKYSKYSRLLEINDKFNYLPKKVIRLQEKTLCGKSRLFLLKYK